MRVSGAPLLIEEFVCPAQDGFPLTAQIAGDAEAPALLLLQGQANSHRWWDGLREAFECSFRTVTMDYRGTGRSRGEVGPWTTTSFAVDAAAVLDRLGVDAAVVYGASMGGRVAQMFAANHPDRVTALVLACTSPGGIHAIERSQDIRRALARASSAERLQLLHDLFYTADWPRPPQESALLGDPSMSRQEAAAHLRASDQHDAWDVLPSIAAPTLILHGQDDRMTPVDNAALLAERIPDARLQVCPRGRHGFFEEFSSHVTPAVLGFLASQVAR
ncbi:alpha/beta hydrolase [Acrocarpospora macrocephala]|uniref:Alpha/beta hydrolase n=1 Tax=Acrocarpospora macrocephala TaxID=150177 RepID=A0A5M3WV44_9ACTN|nr:alpha/beta hydrolase [Acrocarpospora macrocephala]GES12580.1 alpha/beta hydrolase [Acrocarpospora macrocephala]